MDEKLTRQEIDHIYETSKRLKSLQRRREEIRRRLDMVKAVQYKKDLVQESARMGSILEETVIEVEELTKEIDEKLVNESLRSIQLLNKFYDFLSTIKNPIDREIIELRNVHDMSWEAIAREIGSNRETVRQSYYRVINQLP